MKRTIKQRVIVKSEWLAIACRNFSAICPLLEFRRHKAAGRIPELHIDSHVFRLMEPMAEHQARLHGVSVKSIWRWYKGFVEVGYEGVSRGQRNDKGFSRFFDKHPASKAFVDERLAGKTRSFLSIQNDLLRSGHPVPQYNTTAAYCKQQLLILRKKRVTK